MTKPITILWAGLLALSAPAGAQGAKPVLAPDAAAALNKMGAFLRGLDSFEVDVDATTEDVLVSGQKLQFGNQVHYSVNRPDKIAADVSSANAHRRYVYDGATLTVENARDGYYAQLPMTGSIGSLLTAAYEKAGIEFPLQDLFRWGDASAQTMTPSEGFLVGVENVGGFTTNHYAFRQPGVDFQLWLDNSSTPIPRKMVITNLDDPAQPQYVANLKWNMTPKFSPETFAYKPGAQVKKIPLLPQPSSTAKEGPKS